jgi:hypothetical protein
MPSSRYEHISDSVSLIVRLQPRSLLDVGCGFGRWGFLAREFCDIFALRYDKKDWQTQIDAVEVFAGYLCDHHHYIYDNVYIQPIEKFVANMGEYDVIYMGDVIEHIQKAEGMKTLQILRQKAKKAVIIALPLGSKWPQGKFLGNAYEEHRAIWTHKDIKELQPDYLKIYSVNKRPYALVAWSLVLAQPHLWQRVHMHGNRFLHKMGLK